MAKRTGNTGRLEVATWDEGFKVAADHGWTPSNLQTVVPEFPYQPGYICSWKTVPGTMGHPLFTVIISAQQKNGGA